MSRMSAKTMLPPAGPDVNHVDFGVDVTISRVHLGAEDSLGLKTEAGTCACAPAGANKFLQGGSSNWLRREAKPLSINSVHKRLVGAWPLFLADDSNVLPRFIASSEIFDWPIPAKHDLITFLSLSHTHPSDFFKSNTNCSVGTNSKTDRAANFFQNFAT